MDSEWREIKGLGQKDRRSRSGTCKEKKARKCKEKVTGKGVLVLVKRDEEGQRNVKNVMVTLKGGMVDKTKDSEKKSRNVLAAEGNPIKIKENLWS